MIRRNVVTLAALSLSLLIPLGASAAEKAYGDAGTIEAGGLLTFQSASVELKPKSGPGSIKATETLIGVIPEVGYFVSDGFEVGGVLAITHSDLKLTQTGAPSTKTSDTTFQLGGLAAYYLKAGDSMRVGPDVLLLFSSDNQDFGGGNKSTSTGPEVQVGGALKIPFGTGSGGVIGVGLHYLYKNLSVSTKPAPSQKETDTTGDLSTQISYTVFF